MDTRTRAPQCTGNEELRVVLGGRRIDGRRASGAAVISVEQMVSVVHVMSR
jgi:hypothetical protein